MRDLNTIKDRINLLKQEINEKIAECDDLSDNDILILSKRLDVLINQWYRTSRLNSIVITNYKFKQVLK